MASLQISNGWSEPHRLSVTIDGTVAHIHIRRNFIGRTDWALNTADLAVRTTRAIHPATMRYLT